MHQTVSHASNEPKLNRGKFLLGFWRKVIDGLSNDFQATDDG